MPHVEDIGLIIDVKCIIGLCADSDEALFLGARSKSVSQRGTERDIVDFIEVDRFAVALDRQSVAVIGEYKVFGYVRNYIW